MTIVVKSGNRVIGTARTKRGVNFVLAKEYRRENRVYLSKISTKKKRRSPRKKKR